MGKLTQQLLEQYADGELREGKAKQTADLIEASPEHKQALAEVAKIGDLLRLMNEENIKNVSFSGFVESVARNIEESKARLSFWSRMRVWSEEFLRHRRAIWVPTAAAAGALSDRTKSATASSSLSGRSNAGIPEAGTPSRMTASS